MNDYAQRICIHCLVGHCDLCVGRSSDRWCQCFCKWMAATQGDRMTEPIEDDEYAEDAATVPADDLPEPTDPAQIPPDEGDAGAAK